VRFFVDNEWRTKGYEINPLNPKMSIKKSDAYIEVQYRVETTTSSLITYVMSHPQGLPVWFAAACLENIPEFLWDGHP
jgi:hypothetical protein